MKVVSSEEMARVEKWARDHGGEAVVWMQEAGRQVALAAKERLKKGSSVALLIGKGNNGGDAFAAGMFLATWGYRVQALVLWKDCTKKFRSEFEQAGGEVVRELDWKGIDLIVDGFLGTGFRGQVEASMGEAIRSANESGRPILAVDIPSGLNGTTGEIGGVAIRATETVALGFAKIGCFIRSGWNCVGQFRVADFGLPKEAVEETRAVASIPNLRDLKLPPIVRTRHKYQRGFVAGFGGSKALRGAVKLTGLAALHTGAGIVKIFSLEDVGETADELICQVWEEESWQEANGKAQAVFVGPGMGREAEAKLWLQTHLKGISKPCVLDADALYFLPEVKGWPKQAILTPHRGEMVRLLQMKEMGDEEVFLSTCQQFVEKHRVIVVLKGAPTFILAPGELPAIVPRGDPGMATAGSGDVLTGIIAALLAQGKPLYEAAVLGVALHALSGEAAARAKTSHGYTASDLIESLPQALKFFL